MTLSLATFKKCYGIGLTGGIATGKTTVGRLLLQRGYSVIDADQLARAVVEPGSEGLSAVIKTFGEDLLQPDGSLARDRLGQRIFSDVSARQRLEAILHPRIHAQLDERLAALQKTAASQFFFYEATLLVETGHAASFREYWCTLCTPETQLRRLMARQGYDQLRAQQIIATQMPAFEKAHHAAVVIHTDGDLKAVASALDQAIQRLRL